MTACWSEQRDLPFHETYRLAHDVWYDSVQAINELVNRAGLVNVDFADVRAIVEVGGHSSSPAGAVRTGAGLPGSRASDFLAVAR
jgi:cell division GTPase FtsZ